MSTTSQRIAALESQIRELKAAEHDERKALKASVQPKYQFTLLLVENRYASSGNDLWDDRCWFYELMGTIANPEQLKSAGWSESEMYGGSMKYLWNDATSHYVMSHSGGRTFADFAEMRAELEVFVISTDCAGGDVTKIVEKYRKSK